MKLGVIDGIVPEPRGGAHRDWGKTFELFSQALMEHFDPLIKKYLKTPTEGKKIAAERAKKFRTMGELALARTRSGNGSNASDDSHAETN
jgi:acetyl-CoA carboxylase alpha subunit